MDMVQRLLHGDINTFTENEQDMLMFLSDYCDFQDIDEPTDENMLDMVRSYLDDMETMKHSSNLGVFYI